jgi:hypothetical protein
MPQGQNFERIKRTKSQDIIQHCIGHGEDCKNVKMTFQISLQFFAFLLRLICRMLVAPLHTAGPGIA